MGPTGELTDNRPIDTRTEDMMSRPINEPEDGKLGHGFVSADELEEVDIGDGDKPRPTYISRKLCKEVRDELVALLEEFKDCFAWDYSEMPGLSRSIVEHRLPTKPGYRPYKQGARKIDPRYYEAVKEEIIRLYEAGFIRPCRYAEWVSSIVPV